MTTIQLRHLGRLGYCGGTTKSLPAISPRVLAGAEKSTLVSFRPLAQGRPDKTVRGLHACSRMLELPAGDLVLVGIESDSPLAPLLLWDIAHQLPVGCSITVLGESTRPHYLEREHFQQSLKIERDDSDGLVLRKLSPLPAEAEAGLDRWSFCIPVGPEDATHLNVVVKRILELKIPTMEILLCGRPAENFHYFDQVRIVGEDITAPPVRICTKKNRLAQEARYENLCILHDRVFLPSDFARAVRRFGDRFPFVVFQSLYFDDKYNLVPRRYSDFNMAPRVVAQALRGVMRDNDVSSTSAFAAPVLSMTESQGYYYANPLRHSRASCATGSLYMCKRSTWLACQQDERLYWTEFEDIEQGLRADAKGIPSRVNPYAFTQSLSGRALLSQGGSLQYETRRGAVKHHRGFFDPMPIPRKPLIKLAAEQPSRMLARFAAAHIPQELRGEIAATSSVNSKLRIRAATMALQRVRVPIQRKALSEMLLNFEKLVVIDQTPHAWREVIKRQFLEGGQGAVMGMIADNHQLINQYSQRRCGDLFYGELTDYLPKPGLRIFLGSVLSAISLSLVHKEVFFLPGGFISRLRGVLDTTPYRHYASPATQ